MSPKVRRWTAIAAAAAFILMCAAIAWSQWYAYHVNVPACQRHIAAGERC